MFAICQIFLVESRAIVLETPRRHVFGHAAADCHDDVRKKRPRMIEVVLRRPCGVVGMRMVEAQELTAALRRASLGLAIVVGADSESSPRALVGHVRQRKGLVDDAVAADERAAAFIRIGFAGVSPDCGTYAWFQMQHHRRRSPSGNSSQKRSDRYFSPPSQKTTTTTA